MQTTKLPRCSRPYCGGTMFLEVESPRNDSELRCHLCGRVTATADPPTVQREIVEVALSRK